MLGMVIAEPTSHKVSSFLYLSIALHCFIEEYFIQKIYVNCHVYEHKLFNHCDL